MNIRVLLTILGVIAVLTAGSVGYALVTGKIGNHPSKDSSVEESKSAEISAADTSEAEVSKQDGKAADSSKTDSSKADSSKADSSKADSSKDESSKQDSSMNESSAEESSKEESSGAESSEDAESSKEESVAEESKEETADNSSNGEESPEEESHETVEPSHEDYDCTYLVRVNLSTNVVTVYAEDSNGSHTVPVRAMLCSPGPDTPTGTYEMKGRWDILEMVGDVWGQYVSQIIGNYLFHTIPSDEGYSMSNVKRSVNVSEFRKQGTSCSHGCIRLYAGDAYWLYYNTVGNWTSYNPTIIELGYYGAGADPWGTPAKLGVPDYYAESTMWDPTDPSDSNPWRYPSIEIPEDQKTITLNVGDSIPEIDVKGYDGCGYDISGSIQVSSNVNTWAPGDYTITYSLTNYYGYSTSDSVSVTVKSNPVTGVEVDSALSVEVGSTEDLTVNVLPENASNQYVLFASQDNNIDVVDANGTVTGVAEGTTKITVTSDDNAEITAECEVTVIPAPEESKAAEESKTEESKAEESKTEESKAEESKVEESKTEESKAEESKAEESKAEESKAEESKAEESKAEESKTEESKAEESKAEESKQEESTQSGDNSEAQESVIIMSSLEPENGSSEPEDASESGNNPEEGAAESGDSSEGAEETESASDETDSASSEETSTEAESQKP